MTEAGLRAFGQIWDPRILESGQKYCSEGGQIVCKRCRSETLVKRLKGENMHVLEGPQRAAALGSSVSCNTGSFCVAHINHNPAIY